MVSLIFLIYVKRRDISIIKVDNRDLEFRTVRGEDLDRSICEDLCPLRDHCAEMFDPRDTKDELRDFSEFCCSLGDSRLIPRRSIIEEYPELLYEKTSAS